MDEANDELTPAVGRESVEREARRPGLLRQTQLYGVVNGLNAAIPLLLVPVLTRYLSPTDYALLLLFEVTVGVVRPLVGLGTVAALKRRYFDQEKIDLASYLYSALVLPGAAFVLLALVIALARPWIGELSYLPGHWVWILLPVIGGHYLVQLCLAFFQLEHRAIQYGVLQGINTFANLTLSVLFVAVLGFGWKGRIAAQAIAWFAFGIVAALLILRRNRLRGARPSWPLVRDAAQYGLPLVPYTMIGRIVAYTDRALVAGMVSLGAAGVYTVGYQVSGALLLVVQSFSLAWQPWLFRRLKENEPKGRLLIVKALYGSAGILGVAAVALVLGSYLLLPYAVGKEFMGAMEFIPWLAAGLFFRGIGGIVSGLILFVGKNTILMWTTVGTGLLNVVANVYLIGLYGAVGAAKATLVVFALNAVVLWVVGAKMCPLPWTLKSEPSI